MVSNGQPVMAGSAAVVHSRKEKIATMAGMLHHDLLFAKCLTYSFSTTASLAPPGRG